MAMALSGSKGNTARQLSDVLRMPANKSELEAYISSVLPTLRGNEFYSLTTANRMFVQNNFKISDDFK